MNQRVIKHIVSIFFIFISLGTTLFAQKVQINLKVTDRENNDVYITSLKNGAYFGQTTKSIKLTSDDIHLPVYLKKPGFIGIGASGIYVQLYAKAGDRFNVTIQPKNKIEPFVISGANQEGQKLLNINRVFYQKAARNYLKKDTAVEIAVATLNNDLKSEQTQWNNLFDQKKITPDFLQHALLASKYYYAAIKQSIILSKFNFNSQATNLTFEKKYISMLKQLYTEVPVANEVALSVPAYSESYIDKYVHIYLLFIKAKIEDTYNMVNSENQLNVSCNAIRSNFKPGALRENLLANLIYTTASQNNYETSIITQFKLFKKQYPNSIYLSYLKPLADAAITFIKARELKLKAGQKMIANADSINTFKQLCDRFKGKIVFVDMWASWCGPCKAEFVYNQGLQQFIAGKDIEMVYISMDELKAETLWKGLISYHNLSGNHIRANDKLKADLSSLFWDGKGYVIPRYLIINKEGNIVEKDALRPSDKDKLYSQIGKYL